MPTVQSWTEKLSLPVEDFDPEHRELLNQANYLVLALATKNRERTLLAFGGLRHACRTHFSHEHALMERVGYPERAQHAAHHQLLANALDALEGSLGAFEQFDRSSGALAYLQRWLVTHIDTDDRALARWLSANRQDKAAGA